MDSQLNNPEDQSRTKLSANAADGGADDNPFVIGSVVEGKFKIVEVLGRGGMGAVYRAKQLLLNTDVALKTLNAGSVSDPTAMRRFQTEARAAFSLKHRNLVDVHDFGLLESGHPFLVMELIEGTTLQDLLKKKGNIPVKEAEAIFVQLCHGLGYAHMGGVVHRDIKPGNIMLLKDKDVLSEVAVKILDFGIAKIVNSLDSDSEALTKTGELFGSPLYMSPEQCSGGVIDKRTDIYSLGCVFFEALTGTPPFVGQNPLRTMMLHQSERPPTLKEAAMGKEFPAHLERIVGRMLAKEPSRRYQDLSEVSREILGNTSNSTSKHNDAFPSLFDTSFIKSDTTKSSVPTKGKFAFSWWQLSLIAIPLVGLSVGAGFLIRSDKQSPSKTQVSATAQAPATNQAPAKFDEKGLSGFESTDRAGKVYFNKRYQQAESAFVNAKPIVKKEAVRDGQPMLVLNFPPIPIGKVAVNYLVPSKQPIDVNALNDVFVPRDEPPTFVINPSLQPEIAMNAFIFDKIAPDIFTGIASYGQSNVISLITDAQAEDTSPGVEALFRVASRWNLLSEVTMVQSKITKNLVDSLKKMDKLTILKTRNCLIETQDFYDPEIFRKLKVVLVSMTPADPIFKALKGSEKIEVIEVDDDCALNSSSVALLASCPKLRAIRCTLEKFEPGVVAELVKLKTVKRITVNPKSLRESDRSLLSQAHYTLFKSNLEAMIFVRH